MIETTLEIPELLFITVLSTSFILLKNNYFLELGVFLGLFFFPYRNTYKYMYTFVVWGFSFHCFRSNAVSSTYLYAET